MVWGNKTNYELVEEIERLRKERKQSRKAICFEIGISASTLARVINQKRNLSLGVRIDIIRYLNEQ